MTREEIEELKGLAASMGLYDDKTTCKRALILGEAIKALEQEPCEESISRKAVLDMMQMRMSGKELYKAVYDLPSVTPQPKIGQWIKSRDCYGNNHFTCPFCENDIATKYDGVWQDNYCSNCGAKLESKE